MHKEDINNKGLHTMRMRNFMQSGGQPSVQSAATQPKGQQEIEKFVPEIKAALQKGAPLTEIILMLVQKEMPIDLVQQLLMSSGIEENELLNAFEEIQQAQIQDEVASTQIPMPVNEQQEQMIPTEPGMQEQQMGVPTPSMMQYAGEVGEGLDNKGMVMTKFGEDGYVAPELDELIVSTTNPYADKYPYWNQLPEHTKKIIQENNPGPALRSALSTAKHGDGLINPRTGKRNQSYSDEVVSNLVAPGMAFAALPMAAAIGPEILAGLNTPLVAGVSGLDALGAYGAYEGATHLPGHISEFAEDPSWGGAGNIGLDMLGLFGGIGALSKLSKLPAKTKDLFKGSPMPEFGGRRWAELSNMEKQVYLDDAMDKLGPKYGLGTSQVEKNTLNKAYDDLFKDPKNTNRYTTGKIARELRKKNVISNIGGFDFGPAQHTIQDLINRDDAIKNLAKLDEKLSEIWDLGKGSLPTDALNKAKGLGIDDFDFKPMSPGANAMEEAKLLAADIKGPNFARSTNFPSPMNDYQDKLFYQYKSAPPEEMRNLIRKEMMKKFGPDKTLEYAVNKLEEAGRLGTEGYYGKFKPLTRNKLRDDMSNLPSMKGESSPILQDNYRLNELVNKYDSFIKMGIDPNKPGMLSLQDKIKNFPRKNYNDSNEWMKFSGKDVNLRNPLIMNQEGSEINSGKYSDTLDEAQYGLGTANSQNFNPFFTNQGASFRPNINSAYMPMNLGRRGRDPLQAFNTMVEGAGRLFSKKDLDEDGLADGAFRDIKAKRNRKKDLMAGTYKYNVDIDENDPNKYIKDYRDLYEASLPNEFTNIGRRKRKSLRTVEDFEKDLNENTMLKYNPENHTYDFMYNDPRYQSNVREMNWRNLLKRGEKVKGDYINRPNLEGYKSASQFNTEMQGLPEEEKDKRKWVSSQLADFMKQKKYGTLPKGTQFGMDESEGVGYYDKDAALPEGSQKRITNMFMNTFKDGGAKDGTETDLVSFTQELNDAMESLDNPYRTFNPHIQSSKINPPIIGPESDLDALSSTPEFDMSSPEVQALLRNLIQNNIETAPLNSQFIEEPETVELTTEEIAQIMAAGGSVKLL